MVYPNENCKTRQADLHSGWCCQPYVVAFDVRRRSEALLAVL